MMCEYILSTLFLRAKTKQAQMAKSERERYILAALMVLDIEFE